TRYTSFHSQTTTHSAISPLSLHDALPICDKTNCNVDNLEWVTSSENQIHATMNGLQRPQSKLTADDVREIRKLSAKGYSQRKLRSEEHTSELQSRSDLVCRLLLEKKKKKE